MKNTTMLCLLLMLTTFAFGQNGTTADSVLIPRRWFRMATADLLRYEDCRQEVGLLKPRIAARDKMIEALASDTTTKADRIDFLNAQLQSEKILSASLETNCNEQLQRYSLQAKRVKRQSVFRNVLVAIAAGATGYFIHSLTH